jgi:hypothetical protein
MDMVSELNYENDQYCLFIKEKIFNQNNFIEKKNKMLNKFI